MDIKAEVLEIIDELFMEDVSDMMDEDLFDAGVLDSMGTVELIVELENRFDIHDRFTATNHYGYIINNWFP